MTKRSLTDCDASSLRKATSPAIVGETSATNNPPNAAASPRAPSNHRVGTARNRWRANLATSTNTGRPQLLCSFRTVVVWFSSRISL